MVTAAGRQQLRRVIDSDGFLLLLRLEHPAIDTAYVANDTRDWNISGTTWVGLPMRVKLPNDSSQAPRAQIEVDNVSRALAVAMESLPTTGVLQATFQLVSRTTPSVVEYQFSAPLSGVRLTMATLSATLGLDDVMRQAAVRLRYDPTTAPALFEG